MTGNAVVYAPHMMRSDYGSSRAGSWRNFGFTTAGIFALLFYSLCCDPLWSVVHVLLGGVVRCRRVRRCT